MSSLIFFSLLTNYYKVSVLNYFTLVKIQHIGAIDKSHLQVFAHSTYSSKTAPCVSLHLLQPIYCCFRIMLVLLFLIF